MTRGIVIAGAVVAALVAVLVVVLGVAVHDQQRDARWVEHSGQVLDSAQVIERLVIDLETGVRGYVATRDRLFLAPWSAARRELPGQLAHLRGLVSDEPLQELRARRLQASIDSYITGYTDPIVARRSPLPASSLIAFTARGKRLMDALRARFGTFDGTEYALQAARERRSAASGTRLVVLGLGAGALVLVALALFVWYVARKIAFPLRAASAALARLAAGEHELRLPEDGVGEVAVLGRSFNSASAQLAARDRERRDALALHESVLDTAHDAYVALDERGTVIAWNRAAERLFGWTSSEAIGHELEALIAPRFDLRPGGLRQSLARDGENPRMGRLLELVAVGRDGAELPIELSISTVRNEDHVSFHAFVRDIRERRLIERGRDLRLAVSSVLAESATPEEAITRLLPALAEHLDWQLASYWKLDAATGALACAAFWSSEGAAADEVEQLSRELELTLGRGLPGEVAREGEPRWLATDVPPDPVRYPRAHAAWSAGMRAGAGVPLITEGRVVGVLEFFGRKSRRPETSTLDTLRAVSSQIGEFIERKHIEAETDRLKDEFFALVSHELRTPLTSIVGYCEMLLDEDGDHELAPRQRRFLETIDRSAQRLLRLVGDLLFVVQIEASTVRLELGQADLGAIAAAAVEDARPTAEARDVTLELHAETSPMMHGDRDRLGQALDNLIANALKFTPSGGKVSVVLSTEGDDASLVVSDTGIGIPPDEQPLLFDRFFRASTATDRAIPGIGLGLAIVKAIVEGHGGTITVTSLEGQGTTFRMILPIRTHEPGAPAVRELTMRERVR